MDPYSESRYSSTVNRMSRLVTGNQDVVLFPDSSFIATRLSDTELTISPGIAVKDDVLINTTALYTVDFADSNFYVDTIGGLTAAGTYYVVLHYEYIRSSPAPQAFIRIIKDSTIFDNNLELYIFLWAVSVISDGGSGFIIDNAPGNIVDHDVANPLTNRKVLPAVECTTVDGGEI